MAFDVVDVKRLPRVSRETLGYLNLCCYSYRLWGLLELDRVHSAFYEMVMSLRGSKAVNLGVGWTRDDL